MKEYKIILTNGENKPNKVFDIQKLTFPEAVSEAYMTIGKLGFKWRVKSISEIKESIKG